MAFDSRIYLGRLGQLTAIRSPRGNFEAPRQRRTATFELGVGGTAVDQMLGGARVYTLNYDQLFREDWIYLQGFLDGHQGPGPFVLLDPGQRNMLPANMSSSTSLTNDTTNFAVAGSGCTITSGLVTPLDTIGPRGLFWNFANASPGASAAAYITADWPSSWYQYGVPVVAGRPLCFSFTVRSSGAVYTIQPQIIWRDATGSQVTASTAGSGPVTTSVSASTQGYATGTPPVGAVYADWKINYLSGASPGTLIRFRQFMLNEGTTPDTTFAHGTGVWPVRLVAGPEAWPFLSPELRVSPTVVFAEDVT